MKKYLLCIYISLIVFSVSNTFASSLILESSDQPAQFIELYTSQGCSSCPPAERWLSGFTTHDKLWSDIIPINFHVDYWDYIGWKDPFAKKEFTNRQRQYEYIGRSHNVATPGFVINGAGWNGWFKNQPRPKARLGSDIQLKAEISNNTIGINLNSTYKNLSLNIAILGFGIETSVEAGENRDRLLKHDFVVIAYNKQLLRLHNNLGIAQLDLPNTSSIVTTRRAIVVWVSKQFDPSPLQSVSGWLDHL